MNSSRALSAWPVYHDPPLVDESTALESGSFPLKKITLLFTDKLADFVGLIGQFTLKFKPNIAHQ